jgi:hypothetical protein
MAFAVRRLGTQQHRSLNANYNKDYTRMRKNNQRLHLQLKLAIAHFILPLHQRQHDAPRQENTQSSQRVAKQSIGQ